MCESYVERFLDDVKEKETHLSKKEITELKQKGVKIFNALHNQALFLHDPGTYAMLFIVGSGPIYLDSFFQTKSALKMVLSFIQNEDSYLDIPESEQVGMNNYMTHIRKKVSESYSLFLDFFNRTIENQEYILCAIKNSRKMYSRKDVEYLMKGLFESLDEQIEYISGLTVDLKADELMDLYIGSEKNVLEKELTQFLSEKAAEKAMFKLKDQIQQEVDQANEYPEVFHKNGFKLFDFLMKNYLSNGSGSQSDVAFFFRRMTYDKLIHAKQVPFKDFLEKAYPSLEPVGKIKSLDTVNTDKRERVYRTSKSIIGLK